MKSKDKADQGTEVSSLENEELVAELEALVRRSNQITSEVLARLVVVEERQLYLELGFASLLEFCTQALGLSESAAGRRIAAARLCAAHPQAFGRLARGQLHLSALSALASHLTPENANELFDACSGKTRRQIDELLVNRFPKDKVESGSRRRSVEPLGNDRFSVQFTADTEFRDLLSKARALASHRLKGGNLVPLLKLALTELIRKIEKERFGIGAKPRAKKKSKTPSDASPPPGGSKPRQERPKRSRHVPISTARAVYQRDVSRCAYVSKTGRRCTARSLLELDHAEPWAISDDDSPGNVRIYCRAHNAFHARRYFGKRHIDRAIGRARAKRAAA